MPRPCASTNNDVLTRLNYIEGHLGGIRKLVEDDKYCDDILRQTYVVRKATEQLEVLLLEQHLHGCVLDGIPDGIKEGRVAAVIDELYNLTGNR